MAEHSYDNLVAELQRYEAELQDAQREVRSVKHELKNAEARSSKRLVHVKAMQTLNSGIFSALEAQEIYQLACQSVVHQLGWDCAIALTFEDEKAQVKAAYQVTEQQVRHLDEYLGTHPLFTEAYVQRRALITYHSADATSLALRSLFHTDEVVAMPILFGESFYGYLVACAHTKRNDTRDDEDIQFLATLASQIGHAIENSTSFVDLEQQNQKLRQLDELKNSFISITSHQLRTPLSIVKWILSILQTDAEITKLPEQSKLVDQAYVSNERLIHVVNDLLNVSRIQEGKLPHNPQLTDVRIMLRDLFASLERLAEDKHVSLTGNFDVDIPNLQLDPILFREAIQNLLDNAIDYNHEGGRVTVTLEKKESSIKIYVANTGPGIPANEQERIFNQFYRAPEALKQHPNGNGLGLFLSRAIVRQHNGDITCTSEPDKETVFTITLPL